MCVTRSFPMPRTSADLSGKNVDQSQQTSRSGNCTLDLEKFHAWLYSSRKDQKGLIKRWRRYSFRTNYSVNSQEFVLMATLRISLKKITSEVKFAERKSALLQNNYEWKIILSFVQSYKATPPLHHQKNNFTSKHLIQPLQREIYKNPTHIS